MKLKERAELIVKALDMIYPDAACSLEYKKPYELLIATRLSAQCTDARVNIVTRDLFKKYSSLEAFAEADFEELANDIKSCGLYKTKATSIIEMSRQIIEKHGGEIPNTLEGLLSLPGVGRKTANLIMGDVFGKPAIVTDTHCIRISFRLKLTKNKEPFKVEKDLIKVIPLEASAKFCHQLVLFGREFCSARSPKCEICPLRRIFFEKCGEELSCKV
jgi:endonuclease-3